MKQRNLDPCFFNIKRDNKIRKVCLSDMTPSEREACLKHLKRDDMKLLVNKLSDALTFLGDYYDISYKEVEK